MTSPLQESSPQVDTSSDPTASVAPGTGIELEDFHLSAGGRPLLRETSVCFPAGAVTLVLGCSGVGKSLLLRILAGLIDREHPAIHYTGAIRFTNSAGKAQARDHRVHPVAVVFQSFALFDELSPAENIRIAIDHTASDTKDSALHSKKLLDELGVPGDRATSVLSGGQQQRLAIARAIAMQTDVVLYDEPTSGLDTNTAQQVADLVRDTQKKFQRTSVIVTHDYAALLSIADHVILLNHHEQSLQEVPPEQWDQLSQLLGKPPEAADARPTRTGNFTKVRKTIVGALTSSGEFLEHVLLLPVSLLPLWRSFRWGARITWHYLNLVAGLSACLYISVAGLIIGFVAQDFIFRYLPFRQFTEPLLIENLLHATGFSLYRFLVPILCTILIAARSGAAMAADVGSKVYGNQLDAMRTVGMNPWRSVRTPILYAFLIGTPCLTFLSYGVASVTSAVAFLTTHADEGIAFWDAHFHRELRMPATMFYRGTGWLIAKLLACATGTALIAWNCGSRPKQSAAEISRGVTQTILWSTLFTLMVHFVFSLLEFKAPE